MNHFNFFENAQKEKKTLNVPLISAVLLICAIAVLLGVFAVVKIRQSSAAGKLAYLESVENDPQFLNQYLQEEELESNLAKAEEDYIFLRTVDLMVNQGSMVDANLVSTVISCFPTGTKLVKMTVSQNDITIEGVAENIDAMITVEKNLNRIRSFGYVFISTAKEDSHADENGEDAVSFTGRLIIAGKGSGK